MDTMEITTQVGCKNNCTYCPQDKLVRAYAKRSNIFRMGFEAFKVCLDKIPMRINVAFAGMCEPWLNPECTRMVLYAHERGHKIEVFTTLVGMNSADIESLSTVPFEVFWVHLPSEGHYEKIAVDEAYLDILKRLCQSPIKASYLFNGNKLHPQVESLMQSYQKKASKNWLHTRSNNVDIPQRTPAKRIRGIIGCRRKLHYNILLPSGDVILCCMDYGMKHVLGNLLTGSYDDLFRSKEFRKVQLGLWDETRDILCRYCDEMTYDVVKTSCKDMARRFKGRLSRIAGI